MGGMEEEEEDQTPSNSIGGGYEVESHNQEGGDEIELDNQEEEAGEVVAATNPIEGIKNLGAPAVEAEARVALDAAIVEAKVIGAMMIEGYV